MMKSIITKVTHLLPAGLRPRSNETGQSLIILAFVFVSLVVMLGLALDLGIVYIERVRIKRTVDAAALGAVFELPVEEAAVSKAITLIEANGYDLTQTNIYVAGCVQDLQNRFNGSGITDDLINLPAVDITTVLVNPSDVLTTTTNPLTFYLYNRATAVSNAPDFFIDTRSFQSRDDTTGLCSAGKRVSVDASDYGSANKIRVSATQPVRMNFMQFFGFDIVPVSDASIAENASSLDVALVLDTTGSMAYDTICFGCWARCDDPLTLANNSTPVCSAADIYKPYPTNGKAFPFPYPPNPPGTGTAAQTTMLGLIVGDGPDAVANAQVWPPKSGIPDPAGTNPYIIMEAEFYSDNSSNWDPAVRPNGQGYWAIQRQAYNKDTTRDPSSGAAGAFAIDGYGYIDTTTKNTLDGMVRFHPMVENSDTGMPFGKHYTASDAQNGLSPRLEYDFKPGANWTDPVWVHFKSQYYESEAKNNSTPKDEFFWAISTITGTQVYPVSGVANTTDGASNDHNGGWEPAGLGWSWIDANTNTTLDVNTTYKLQIWAGSGGYTFDRIIISTAEDVSAHWNKPATPGSAQRLAADPCNPIFGLNVLQTSCTYSTIFGPTNNLNNPLFDDVNPIRSAKQAMRNFVARLDPKLDQVGFLTFAGDAGQRVQMECLRASRQRAAAGVDHATYPFSSGTYPNYDETECDDPTQAASGTVPISYTVVFKGIEAVRPEGGTDIADGMRRGLNLLGIKTETGTTQDNNCVWIWENSSSTWKIRNAGTSGTYTAQPVPVDSQPASPFAGLNNENPTGHCGRGAAATSIMVLLTDGAPNNGDPGDNDKCKAWDEDNPPPYTSFPSDSNSDSETKQNNYGCMMYYAEMAADHGVLVYVIGLGAGVDADILRAVANTTHGQYYYAPSGSQLDSIFDQILANVYVRLIQ
jgi:Flp pilus assembly protein TadG